MDLNEIIRQLKASVFALDNLQVKGRENWDIALGTIQNIERQISNLTRFKKDLDESFKIENKPAEEGPVEPAE